MNKVIDYIIVFVAGLTVMALINSITLSLHSPGRIMVIIFALVAAAAAAIIAYTLGRRKTQKSTMAAYNHGIERGKQLGRAEIQSEVQKFLEVD